MARRLAISRQPLVNLSRDALFARRRDQECDFETARAILDDDEFRYRLFDTVAAHVEQHRERGTVHTRGVILVKMSTGCPSAAAKT